MKVDIRHSKVLLEYYRVITCGDVQEIKDIPKESLSFLLVMSYDEMVGPLTRYHKSRGFTIRQLSIKYGIPKSNVQRLVGG